MLFIFNRFSRKTTISKMASLASPTDAFEETTKTERKYTGEFYLDEEGSDDEEDEEDEKGSDSEEESEEHEEHEDVWARYRDVVQEFGNGDFITGRVNVLEIQQSVIEDAIKKVMDGSEDELDKHIAVRGRSATLPRTHRWGVHKKEQKLARLAVTRFTEAIEAYIAKPESFVPVKNEHTRPTDEELKKMTDKEIEAEAIKVVVHKARREAATSICAVFEEYIAKNGVPEEKPEKWHEEMYWKEARKRLKVVFDEMMEAKTK